MTGATSTAAAPAAAIGTPLGHALALAARGFNIFPIRAGSKKPAIIGFPTLATSDPEQIHVWAAQFPGANWGISTNELLAVDVDMKSGKNGEASLFDLQLEHGAKLPDTYVQKTPTGGTHYLFRSSHPVPNSAGKLGDGLDVRGRGGFVVAAGSVVEAGVYTANDLPLADAPAWLVELVGATRERTASTESVAVATEVDVMRAVEYLKTVEPALDGAGGNTHSFAVAARVKDFGISEAETLGLMLEFFNDRCLPPWEVSELQVIVGNAFRYGSKPQGSDAIGAMFQDLTGGVPAPAAPKRQSEEEEALSKVNNRYAQVNLGGKVVVLHERPALLPTETLVEYMGVDDFRAWLKGHTVKVNTEAGSKNVDLASHWLGWRDRRRYNRVVFMPGKETPEGALNLWRGFSVEPVAGKWTEMKRHMLVNVCQRKRAHYEYLLNWLAHAVQYPGQASEVALVLQGGRGTGKGILARAIGHLFGPHFYHASRADEIVGQFNAHLEQTALLFADEAFFAGDRQHGAQMKRLITEPTIAVEQKYLPRRMVQNNLHVIFASNDAWVVPAGLDERRFAVYTMGTEYQQDRAFFRKVVDELNGGGHAAMLHDLLNRDISGFDPRAVPQTEGLVQQKIESLTGVDAWLHESLDGCDLAGREWRAEPLDIPKGDVWVAFDHWQSRRRYGRRVERSALHKRLDEVLHPTEHRPRLNNPARDRYLAFPPIGEAREAFARVVRGTPAWSPTTESVTESPGRATPLENVFG